MSAIVDNSVLEEVEEEGEEDSESKVEVSVSHRNS